MPPEAILATLRHLFETLRRLDISAALMGGLALATWKHPRFTKDIDLLVALGSTDIDALLSVLTKAGFRTKGDTPLVRIGEMELLQVFYEPAGTYVDVQIDLFPVRTTHQQEAIGRRAPVNNAELGFEIDVLACEDLIVLKLLAGRIIDLADCQALLRANRTSLDLEYLVPWIGRLRLRAEFEQAWEEAFPGERPPA